MLFFTNLDSTIWNWSHQSVTLSERKLPTWHIKSQRKEYLNLKAIAECAPPQTYTKVPAFLGLVGHYRRFIKGFAYIAQPLNEHLTRAGASRKSEWVSLLEDTLKAFEALKQACMIAPVLAFANYTKPFLLETDASKDGLGGSAGPGSRQMDDTTQLPMAAGPLCLIRKTTIWLSLSFWCWSGWLQNISRSTCPINLFS